LNEKATNSDESRPAVGGPGCNEGLGPLPTIPPGETDAEFVAQIEATHCRPLTPPERMPQYIRDELPDELAAHRLQAWADARVAAERERCAVAAWNYYMDICKKRGLPAAMCDEWCAAGAIRGPNA
jgi:hypothetical protein